jgi:hypothetical protein
MSQRVTRPNLFIIGAMKSGTTSLHDLLGTHPDVFMADPKEPSYFAPDRTRDSNFHFRGLRSYQRLFERAGRVRYAGESSTNYTKAPESDGVAARLRAFNPDARLIYLMRDPVERAVSHYWHRVRAHSETRELLAAMKEGAHYLAVSDYACQLKPYLALFGSGQVRALTFESFVGDPAATLRGLCEWLQIDPNFAFPTARDASNRTPAVVYRERASCRCLIRVRRSLPGRGLAKACPRAVVEWVDRRLFDKLIVKEQDTSEACNFLRDRLLPQVKELSLLLGREFPEWRTLYAASGVTAVTCQNNHATTP